MIDWLIHAEPSMALNWTDALWGLLLFVATSIGGIVLARLVVVKLPADYFCHVSPRDFWIDRHPLIRWTGLIFKNLLGVTIVILGIILSLPGVPGPGILTILIGVLLLDFPGKRALERWLINRPMVLNSVNRLRRRYGRRPLVLEEAGADEAMRLKQQRASSTSLARREHRSHLYWRSQRLGSNRTHFPNGGEPDV